MTLIQKIIRHFGKALRALDLRFDDLGAAPTLALRTGLDEQTIRQIMNYYDITNHDVVAMYVKNLGIAHND